VVRAVAGCERAGGSWPLWLVGAVLFGLSVLLAPAAGPDDRVPGPAAELDRLEQAFQSVLQRVAPSVVGIRAVRQQSLGYSPTADGEGGQLEQSVVVNGAGTVLSPDGLILTNEHVVHGASEIRVFFWDGRQSPALVVSADPRSDLAVLQVSPSDLQPAVLCDWDTVARGQWVVVLGNPFGLGQDGRLSVSVGIVANLGRQLPGLGEEDDRFYCDMVQVTAPIHPGNSGGPLFNLHGELLGVVTAMHTRGAADQGIGFAIPLTPAKRRVIEALCRGQTIEYGYLGATVRAPNAAERMLLSSSQGVVVQEVDPDGPAQQAGIRVDDVILAYQEEPVRGPAHLAELVGQSPVRASVRLAVWREGRTMTITATLGRRDGQRVAILRQRAAGP